MNHDVIDIRTVPSSDLSIRDGTDGRMVIEGYATLFNVPSKPMPFIEYISPHAFDGVDLSSVLLLYSHEFDNILARTDSDTLTLTVDDKGLFFSAVLPNTQLGRDTYENIANGNVKGCSFGFKIAEGGDTMAKNAEGQMIHTINQVEKVVEVSLTPIPAYTETSVQVKRSMEQFLQRSDTEMKNEKQKETPVSTEPKDDKKSTEDRVTALLEKLEGVLEGAKEPNKMPATEEKSEVDKSVETPKPEARDDDDGEDIQEDADKPEAETPVGEPDDKDKPKLVAASADKEEDKPTPVDVTKKQNRSAVVEITKEENPKMKVLDQKEDLQKRSFAEYLKTGEVTRDVTDGGIGLDKGSVIIPEIILPVEKEQYQFPRLATLVRTVAVKTTTGKLPVFMNSTDKLTKHTEFGNSTRNAFPDVLPVKWDLQTFTGSYVFSQELLSDSDYDWSSDLQGRLGELRDNTDDSLIMAALTTGVKATVADDVVSAIKTALNVTLKPVDAQNASIILSQSAYNVLDQEKDEMGRPLIQPDVTKGTGFQLLGKSLVVVEDTLFPEADAGDVNVVVAPLQKAVIRFKQSEITGQFQDTYDVWYKILGIFLREDVVQARQDLIVYIKQDPKV